MAIPQTEEELEQWLLAKAQDPKFAIEFCRRVHLYSDVDKSKRSQHHTVGGLSNQAKAN